MTINTPQQAPAVEAKCQKCGSQAKSVEYDIIGMVITCAICGKCVYMDRNNQPIEEQQKLEKTKTNIQKSDTPVEAAPGTAEIRQGYNLEYQERQPKERSWETAIDEPEESEMEPETNEVEESEMETETSEAEEPKIETITSEAEESKMETITSETEESKMETESKIPANPSRRLRPTRSKNPSWRLGPARPKNLSRRLLPTKPRNPSRRLLPTKPKNPSRRLRPARPKDPSRKLRPARPRNLSRRLRPARPKRPNGLQQARQESRKYKMMDAPTAANPRISGTSDDSNGQRSGNVQHA